MNNEKTMPDKVSIIIPVLNEEAEIGELLSLLKEKFPEVEIIVADGGSTDSTVDIAKEMVQVVFSEKGRAIQMNTGARSAAGDILWFLHADCLPSPESVKLIRNTFIDDSVVAGAFRWKLDGEKWYYQLITGMAHKKNKTRTKFFGDMGIFIRSTVFKEMNGYQEIPLMEEVELNKRIRQYGEIVILDEPLISSDRRLMKNGPIWSFITNNIIKFAYSFGFSSEFLAKFYK